MPAPTLILPPAGRTPAHLRSSRGYRRALPPDLLRESSARLGILALVGATLWLLGPLLGHFSLSAADPSGVRRWFTPVFPMDAVAVTCIALSLALFAYTRRSDSDPQRMLDIGLGYMVLISLGIGIMFHVGDVSEFEGLPASGGVPPEISWIGAIVLIFAAIVPTAPAKTLAAGLIAASMNPIAMLIAGSSGQLDGVAIRGSILMHYPDFLLVGVAVVISHVVTGLGRQVTKAREMGSYQIGELLERGGMGEVYRATHRMLARPAAIKLIRSESLGDGEEAQVAAKRFYREAEVAASLRSPHTVEVYDFGVTEDETLYIVMEMLDGMDLESLIARHGPLTPGRTIHIVRQVCDSLEEAHARGVVHGDIKPANIHVGRLGLHHDFVKVLDFGLVRLVSGAKSGQSLDGATGMMPGTPSYMAPELVLGELVDGRADIYAVGCVAYYLLTGRLVFEAEHMLQMVVKHVEAQPVPPSERAGQRIPRSLDDAVLACLAKDPAKRTRSAAELERTLAAIASEVEPWGEEEAARWWSEHGEARGTGARVEP